MQPYYEGIHDNLSVGIQFTVPVDSVTATDAQSIEESHQHCAKKQPRFSHVMPSQLRTSIPLPHPLP